MKEEKFNKGKIIIYKTSKYEVKLDVRLEEETVWLSQKQMAALFNKGTPQSMNILKIFIGSEN